MDPNKKVIMRSILSYVIYSWNCDSNDVCGIDRPNKMLLEEHLLVRAFKFSYDSNQEDTLAIARA